MAEQGISKEQDREYVLQQASLLVHIDPSPNVNADPAWHQAYRDLRTAVAFYEAHDKPEAQMSRAKSRREIRREITRWMEDQIRDQGVPGAAWLDRSEWPQCPLVNPNCPDDLCILPAGHVGTAEGYHVLGTMAYTEAGKFSMELMMPVGTDAQVLCQEGWRRADIMFPRDRA